MNRFWHSKPAIFLLAGILLAGLCFWPNNAAANREQDTLKVEPLPRIRSMQHLKELLAARSYDYPIMFNSIQGRVSAAMDVGAAAPEMAMGKSDHSSTNVQVEGVDEADLVKTDGNYIYQVKPDTGEVLIIQALPASDMKVAARISFDQRRFIPCEMYVADNQLVVIGNANNSMPIHYPLQEKVPIVPPIYKYYPTTQVVIYDITNRTNPVKVRELELEGSYLTSRRINAALYVISNQPTYNILREDNPLPRYRDSAKGGQFDAVPFDKIAYFPDSIYSSYILMAGLRLDQPQQEAQLETILGSADNVYASATGLYIATPYQITLSIPYDQNLPVHNEDKTQIFYFRLNNGSFSYAARGEVPGHTLNQFSMDEYQGVLRIATTSGQEWWRNQPVSSNNLYTLDQELNLLGKVENIAPGELIYSTRFMGPRAYMVTFRTVDPFFVIDVSDPKSPKVLGKLKIPGYSNYLHPYDDNNIMGFGKDTIEVKEFYGTQAYYQGMKMAMFDVSNVAAPVEKDREIIGDRGTDSELLSNHRALLFSREKGLLAFPVTVMEAVDDADTMPVYGSFAFQGAYIYEVNNQGFTLKGRITHLTGDDYLKAGDYWGGTDKSIRRILYIGDVLYTLSDNMIQAHQMKDLKYLGSLSLQ
ncbi:MAG TPA: beta-propeller domain-containing protein [Syntrophomonadaceae bacterium]|nr:beta-propeller domain-containing protein [Syntrophomonadaceae bacterium]